ncbi:MAG TPA: hypothetical protein VND64_20515 [Pirellulales bacterium]|nr:hypothetical protein [Pirellulales bacterium]
MTILRPYHDPKTGNVRRVYVRRPQLTAKLWFEKSKSWDAGFEVRFDSTRGQFSLDSTAGEATHVAEARAALGEAGLDMTTCTWNDIVERCKAQAPRSRSLVERVARFLPFGGRRLAS